MTILPSTKTQKCKILRNPYQDGSTVVLGEVWSESRKQRQSRHILFQSCRRRTSEGGPARFESCRGWRSPGLEEASEGQPPTVQEHPGPSCGRKYPERPEQTSWRPEKEALVEKRPKTPHSEAKTATATATATSQAFISVSKKLCPRSLSDQVAKTFECDATFRLNRSDVRNMEDDEERMVGQVRH